MSPYVFPFDGRVEHWVVVVIFDGVDSTHYVSDSVGCTQIIVSLRVSMNKQVICVSCDERGGKTKIIVGAAVVVCSDCDGSFLDFCVCIGLAP